MRELGEYLKQMREAQGVTLEDVAKKTKVNIKFLKAIEDGNWDLLPAKVYARGYINAYGEYLGADLGELKARFDKAISEQTFSDARSREVRKLKALKRADTGEEIPFTGAESLEKADRKFHFQKEYIFLSVILVLVIIVVILALRGGKEGEFVPRVEDMVVDTLATTGSWDVTPSEEDLAQEIRLEVGKINPAWAIGRSDSLTLTVKAQDDTWLLVETDYKRAFKGTLKYKTSDEWRAKNSFYLTIGRPEAVTLEINGFQLKPFEATGFPKEVTIDRGDVLSMLEGHDDFVLPPSLIPPRLPDDTTYIDSSQLPMDSVAPDSEQRGTTTAPVNTREGRGN
ncbi:helix-turn-helix domain-containing protein [bacterium]|nr:helix-turn-helix domain-containing protein [bacterium]